MPRSRGSDLPQRQSPRGSHQVRSSSSDSDPLHHRPVADRSPKLGDRRSPRSGGQSDSSQKKLGTRIADLESQLGQAQEELKVLKDQLASAEAAKRQVQEELEKKTKKASVLVPVANEEKSSPTENKESNDTDGITHDEAPDDNQHETDVFEVPVEAVHPKVEISQSSDQHEREAKPVDISTEQLAVPEPQKLSLDDFAMKDDEIKLLKAKVEEKEKELEASSQENETLKKQLNEANAEISSAKTREEEMSLKLSQMTNGLEVSKESGVQMKKKLESVEAAKEALEAEMKKLRIQTDQWRKAADAAAAVLAGGVDMNGRISDRCNSMDKQFNGVFETPAGVYNGYLSSPGMADYSDDGFGSGKRKGSGIRMFGDLWKKKGHK